MGLSLHRVPVHRGERPSACEGHPVYLQGISDPERFHPTPADSLMVERLRKAGAIIIGKTNAPEFGLGSHTYNPVYGITRNAYDQTRSAGGSSGGCAAGLRLALLACYRWQTARTMGVAFAIQRAGITP